ncbi:MAG: alpha/beta fold hydrolase [Agathobacter sp.]|nr:alpha/beta fold hydrolase [Agathobacter sp.]
MVTSNFTFLSNDGKTAVHAVKWTPDEEHYKAILQITHGMVEFIERYIPFAEFLTSKGYMVVGHDHIGHGQSVATRDDWGYFCEDSPSDVLVEDMHKLRIMIQEDNPDVPYFMMGHSMGSFLLRKYLTVHGEKLRGAIIMGTGFIPWNMSDLALKISSVVAKLRGPKYRSKLVQSLAFGADYEGFDMTGEKPENSWLTKDVEVVKAYYNEPRCTYMFTVNGYKGLFEAVNFSCKLENAENLPKKLPLFIVSGAKDPVGGLGKGVKKVYDMYKEVGMLDLTYKLYADDRHEILNETDKQVVFEDLLAWMNVRIDT